MTSRPEYLLYLEAARRAEIADRLRQQGYSIEFEKRVGSVVFDLVASKVGKTIVYEIKSAQEPKSDRTMLLQLQQVAKELGYELRIAIAVPPRKVNVEIDDLTEQLQDYMTNDFPSELDSLSTHTTLDEVTDIDVSDIHVGHGEIRVGGTGSVEVGLQFGGHADEPALSGDSFPFTFSAILSPEGRLLSVPELSIDTSSSHR